MNPLDEFLDRVGGHLRSMPGWKREEELRELRSHLEQRVEDFEHEGLKTEEAQARAVEAFGSPKALGGKLCDAWEGVPTSWRGIAAGVLKTITIWFVAQMVWWTPLVVLSHLASISPYTPTPTYLYIFLVFALLSTLVVSIYCGILLSSLLGRRGPMVVLAAPFLAALLADVVFVVEHYIPVELYVPEGNMFYQQVAGLFLELLFTFPLWLLGAAMFRIIQVRRLRSLPRGEVPNAKGNFGPFLRFKSRKG